MGILDKFIEYIIVQKRYSKRTALLYEDSIGKYYKYIFADNYSAQLNDNEYLEVLTTLNIRGFILEQTKGGLNARTINLHLSALSSYCKWLIKKGSINENPVSKIIRPKEKKRLPEFYKKEALDAYFAKDIEDNYPAYRNKLVVLMLYTTGMRREEISNLKINQLDIKRRVIRVVGKGNKEREIPIIDILYENILVYLQQRDLFYQGENNALFLTEKHNTMYVQFVNKIVREELAAFKEFSGKKSPHVLRHTFATHLLNNGAKLNSIKEVLGHQSLAATQVYTHNSFEQLKKVYNNAHPRAKKGG